MNKDHPLYKVTQAYRDATLVCKKHKISYAIDDKCTKCEEVKKNE